MILTMSLTLICCNPNAGKKVIRVGYLAGPTGMGMAKLISDNADNQGYSFTKYADSNAAKTDLAAGKIDIICLPTNEAAQYYAKVDSTAKLLAVNCLNSLYLLTKGEDQVNSLSELEGQTIYTCKNGTPKMVLEYILKEAGINAEVSYEIGDKVMLTPQDLSTCVSLGLVPNAVMPEPIVTSTLMTISKNGDKSVHYTVDVDLSDEWAKISSTPIAMGCIIANGDFVRENPTLLADFLSEYKGSVEYIGNNENLDSAANYVVENGIMGAAPAAKMALKNLGKSISYIDGDQMKDTLVSFYTALGIALPDDDFYYEK